MNADEMFKELGYKKKHQIYKDEVLLIGYTKEDEEAEECSIMFLKKAKRVKTNFHSFLYVLILILFSYILYHVS